MRAHQQGYARHPDASRHQPRPSRYHHPTPPPRRDRIDGGSVGIAAVWLVLGFVLGGGTVFFGVGDRADGGSAAPAALVDTVRQALPGDNDEPKTEEAVRTAVQEFTDRYSSGDYAGSWDMWIAAAKREFSRDDYVRLFELCPQPAEGLRFTIDAVDYQPGADTATVRMSRLIVTFNQELVYQDGRWTVVPTAENLAEYRQYPTAEALADYRRGQGGCA